MIEGSAAGASRLLEALEKLASWAGQAHGDAPSDAPSQEIVQAFEAAMQADGPTGAVDPSSGATASAVPQADVPDGAPPVGASTDMAADGATASPSDVVRDPAMTAQVGGVTDTTVPPSAFPDVSAVPDAAQGQMHTRETLSPGPAERIQDASGFFSTDKGAATSRLAPQSAADTVAPADSVGPRGAMHGGPSLDRYAPTAPAQASASTPQDALRELGSLVEQMGRSGAQVSPDTLFRVQYLVGMLKLQVQTGFHASQQGSQGLENLVRQSG